MQIKDGYRSGIQICIFVVRIMGHASQLKTGDIRLENQPNSQTVCDMRGLFVVENIHHLIMQWPRTQTERDGLF